MNLSQLRAQPKSREGDAFADGWLSPLGVFYPKADPRVLAAHQYNSIHGDKELHAHGWIEISWFLGVKLRTVPSVTKAQLETIRRLNRIWDNDLQFDIETLKPYAKGK